MFEGSEVTHISERVYLDYLEVLQQCSLRPWSGYGQHV